VTEFLVEQSEAVFEAHFAFPAFALLASAPSLHENMLLGLGKYGLPLSNILEVPLLEQFNASQYVWSLSREILWT
jgi:hypothetical protein